MIDVRERKRQHHRAGGVSRCKQADSQAANINVIMRRWREKGIVPKGHLNPRYGDFASGLTYHEALNRLKVAEGEFARLPSAVRKHCKNDAGEFLDMVNDPDRREELEDLGLVEALVPDKEPVVEPTPDPVEPGEA